MRFMQRIDKNLACCNDYLSGVQQIWKHESVCEILKGVGKTISYLTIVLPVIFGIGYLITERKKINLQNLYDRVITNLEDSNFNSLPQKDYINFLKSKVEDNQLNEFEEVFRRLNGKSQQLFFAKMAEQSCLIQVMKILPKDLTKIEFSLGSPGSYPHSYKKSSLLVKEFFKELKQFTNLTEVVIDLKGIHPGNTPRMRAHLAGEKFTAEYKARQNFKHWHCHSSEEIERAFILGYGVVATNWQAGQFTINGIHELLKESEKISKISVIFKDINFDVEFSDGRQNINARFIKN